MVTIILHCPRLRDAKLSYAMVTPPMAMMHEACLLLFLHRYNRERAILLK